MEIKIGDRVYTISDACPSDRPRPATLRRNLREHGPESFVSSHKLARFASCVLDELFREGAELVDQDDESLEPDQEEEDDTRCDCEDDEDE